MDTGLLSLKWNNHSSTFFHVLETIRKKELYSDVTIACDGKFFSVHKLVLSTCSEYFQEMFERTQCKHPIIVLKDINHKDLESLLNYMYIGEVNVIQTELSSLIKAAECLKVKGLAVPDEPPSTNRKAAKRPNVPDRDRDEGFVHKRNRRNTPVNAMPDQLQNTSEERTPLNNMSPSPNMTVDSDRDNIEKEKRLHAEDHQSSTHNFKEFEPVMVKLEKDDSAPDNFVQEELPELPPVSKFEFHGSPVDSTISSGLDEGNESSYGAPLQQPHSEESMSHLIPSTSRYGESSNWPSEMDNLDKGDKEGGGGGEAGNYEPNPNAFLLDNSQGKAQMVMQEFQGLTSNSKLFIDQQNFVYKINKKLRNGNILVRCHTLDCPVRGTIAAGEPHLRGVHSHYPDLSYVTKCRFLSTLKARAKIEGTPFRIIYDEEVLRYPGENPPPFSSLESTMYKQRNCNRAQISRTLEECNWGSS